MGEYDAGLSPVTRVLEVPGCPLYLPGYSGRHNSNYRWLSHSQTAH